MSAKKTGPCCEAFVRLHSNVGRRGFSIRVHQPEGKATLQFNAVPEQDEARTSEALNAAKVVAQTMGRESIAYCPFCGARLGT
jgi:hypothetical protein